MVTVQVRSALAIFVLALAGCSTGQNQPYAFMRDGGFLTGKPCGAPCFMGITPGQTTETMLKDTLVKLSISDQCKPFANTSDPGDKGLICRGSMIFHIDRDTQEVKSLGFNPYDEIDVSKALKKYGPPQHVDIVNTGLPESPGTKMLLYYDDIRAVVALADQTGRSYNLAPETGIANIGYFSPASYAGQVASFSKYFLRWKGYGEYEIQGQP
jgi:hypothetical protein